MEMAVNKLTRLAGVLAFGSALCLFQAPAHAQFGFGGSEGGEDMMTTMAPMLNMMKKQMGEKRFGELMKTVGPIATKMMDGNGGGLSGIGNLGIDGLDIGSMSGLMSDGTVQSLMGMVTSGGGGRKGRRRHSPID